MYFQFIKYSNIPISLDPQSFVFLFLILFCIILTLQYLAINSEIDKEKALKLRQKEDQSKKISKLYPK